MALLLVFFVITILCLKGLSHPSIPQAPLLHEDKYLIIPEGSPIRNAVSIKKVSNQNISVPFVLPAVVTVIPTQFVKVFLPISGRITSIYKQAGASVSQGEDLFEVTSADITAVISDASKAQAAFTLAKEALERQQKLLDSQIGSLYNLQMAQNNYTQALSELNSANTRLSILKINQSLTSGSNDKMVIRSPLSGHVIEVNAGIGSYWNDTSTPIMSVADLSTVYVVASVQERDVGKVFIGQDVGLQFDAYAYHYPAKVDYIHPILDEKTRTVKISMVLQNKDTKFKPNMFAKAVFLGKPHRGILLPVKAVIQRGFESIVFVQVADWKFEPRLVCLGSQIGSEVEILSGVLDNEQVVVTGSTLLND